MVSNAMRRILMALFLLVSPSLTLSPPVLSQTTAKPDGMGELKRSFGSFLRVYRDEIRRRNAIYLESAHPKLPEKMYDFFFDVTIRMMRFSEQQGLMPTIECQEFKVCKAVYPQPNGSWAAQRFVLYESRWRWLDQ